MDEFMEVESTCKNQNIWVEGAARPVALQRDFGKSTHWQRE